MICAEPTTTINFPPSALPVDRGDMQQETLPDGRIRLTYAYRGPKGPTNIKATLPRDIRISDIIKAKAQLVEKAEKRSLKSQVALFEDAVKIVVEQNCGAGMQWVYDRIENELAGPMDMTFVARYNRYIDDLHSEKKSANTISNHKSAIQRVLNFAWKRRMIDDIPVRDFGIKREFRDRVLSSAERQRLENVMRWWVSHLYWSIRFAECRPVRGLSDLWNLKKENLVLFGEGAPYIWFSAKKTDLPTIVPLADLPEIVEYFNQALPANCPYLFPKLTGDIKSVDDFEGMARAEWARMGDPRTHFERLKTLAKIPDFHFHDFKRIATTHMLDNGYSAEDLIDLKFYATRDMIDKCYKKRDAMAVLRRISVAPEVAPQEKSCFNKYKNQRVANSTN